ncbi:MAG: biotin--[acetyl-CoA-carboxylase] ligase [Oscillospiraceae bacterium]|jgi:BirA family biotin operon repressor/biotin-[acetyl-CoA-carboxylase] ligase|nr:biotin--[acetyl-CoA-carboxylase] ligase [Oscillospiraceae bacterium]
MMREPDELLVILSDGMFHSGKTLSRRVGITRAAIWKRIEALRESGLTIDSAGKRGYRLIKPDDPLFPPLFSAPGCDVRYSFELPSTNTTAALLAAEGAAHGTLVVAEKQRAGKGRRGRGWASEVGGAMFSLVLRPTCAPARAQRTPLVAAIAVAEACETVCGVSPLVKWPNDVIVGGKKLCGILLELSAEAEQILYLVLGVGINVAQREKDFPENLRDIATSLAIESGHTVRRSDIITAFVERFFYWYKRMSSEPEYAFWHAFEPIYRERSATLGRRVNVAQASGSFEGTAIRLGDSGELIVRADGGEDRAVWAADVTVRMRTDLSESHKEAQSRDE